MKIVAPEGKRAKLSDTSISSSLSLDMYTLDDDSDLEYVAGNIDYADFADHFASSSVGAYTMDQFDGAMTDNDTDMDDPEEKGEPEKNPGRAPSDTSSVSSDEIIDMEVEAEDVFPEINEESQPEREKDEDLSKQKEQDKEEGWTKN